MATNVEKAKEYLARYNAEYDTVIGLPSHALVTISGVTLPADITDSTGNRIEVEGGQFPKPKALEILEVVIESLKEIVGGADDTEESVVPNKEVTEEVVSTEIEDETEDTLEVVEAQEGETNEN